MMVMWLSLWSSGIQHLHCTVHGLINKRSQTMIGQFQVIVFTMTQLWSIPCGVLNLVCSQQLCNGQKWSVALQFHMISSDVLRDEEMTLVIINDWRFLWNISNGFFTNVDNCITGYCLILPVGTISHVNMSGSPHYILQLRAVKQIRNCLRA